ncbi:hypothetical protein [Pseudomonas extremaustralis]|uniref:Uncharacterized protein n=1 Tax=Pseudomonas extremaustralis TaxID=359110 RepID=A0A5C5QAZ9_9PSED|nr:hypothetical protein [Pseudomonas extremaustralis]EZI23141.1 hypothetical protein PE143B_0130770 [Pseudomonas extremaustralis 14-3 substr. 14-3b]TWS02847.1 hypothetical protein FIV36_17985 [Pseudomonas extremaustralis]SDE69448.1 hypothetical protein SAMN05216591_0643 [Pseudomonas extremaustralis]
MSLQQRDHDTAVGWINAELAELRRDVGKPNASAAARSAITLAFLLRTISDTEQREFQARIDEIYDDYTSTQSTAA